MGTNAGVSADAPALDIVYKLVRLADRFMRNRHFPDKALDLLDHCVASAVTRGRQEVTADDARAIWEVYQAFEGASFSLKELLLAIVTSDPFTHRRAPAAGEAPACDP